MTVAATERLIALVDRSIQVSEDNTRQLRVSADGLNSAVADLRAELREDRSRGEQATRELTEAITDLRVYVGRLDERTLATDRRLDERLEATNRRLDDGFKQLQAAIQAQSVQISDLVQSMHTLDRRMLRFETIVVVLVTVASVVLATLQVFLR